MNDRTIWLASAPGSHLSNCVNIRLRLPTFVVFISLMAQGSGSAASQDSEWSAPRTIEKAPNWTAHNSMSAVHCWSLSKWNNTLLCRKGASEWLILRDDGSNWVEATLEATNSWVVFLAPADDFGLLGRMELAKDKHQLSLSFRRIESGPDSLIALGATSELVLTRKELFGGPPAGKPFSLVLSYATCGPGARDGTNVYVPYYVTTEEVSLSSAGVQQTTLGIGPAEAGVLASSDRGASWTRTRLLGFESWVQAIKATQGAAHLFAHEPQGKIWCSTKLRQESAWSTPQLLVNSAYTGHFMADAGDDIAHLCWLDERKKEGLGFLLYGRLGGPNDRRNRIYYRNKKDGDAAWSKEVLLSGSMSWVGQPVMSAEGNRIVVAWGNRTGQLKADIYYCMSKDNGQTWTRPSRLTDSEGPSAECPKIALFRGVIHLFYTEQGNLVYRNRPFPAR